MTISVVIPAYNEARSIGACLDSLQAQTRPADEIIVVDNNCTDETVAIAQRYPTVRVVREERPGISYARTAGFDAANSDIIARLDADSFAAPTWLAAIVETFSAHPDVSALGGRTAAMELSPKGKFWGSSLSRINRLGAELLSGKQPMMHGHNCALRRELWQTIRQYTHLGDDGVNEDVDVSLLAHQFGVVRHEPSMVIKTPMWELYFNLPKVIRYARTTRQTITRHQARFKQ